MKIEHKDILGNKLKVGDFIITPATYYKELAIRKIISFTPKGLRTKLYNRALDGLSGSKIILNIENTVCKIEDPTINLNKQ